jgi:hypothetical protein
MVITERTSLSCLANSTPQRIRASDDYHTLQVVKNLLDQALSLPQDKCRQEASSRNKRQRRGGKCQSKSPNLHSYEVILSFPVPDSQSVSPMPTLSPGEELYCQFAKSYQSVADFLQQGPQALQLGFAASSNDVILADIQRFSSSGIDHQRGPFALLALRTIYEQSKASASVFAELNFPKQWQAVRHAITDGRKLKLIVRHGGQGMIPLMACHYHKWRYLPDEEVQTFVDHCKKDKRFAALIHNFELRIDSYEAAYRLSLSPGGLQVRPSSQGAAYHETPGDFNQSQTSADFSIWAAQFNQGMAGSQNFLDWGNDYQVNIADDMLSPELFGPPCGYQDARTFTGDVHQNRTSHIHTT